VDQLEIIHLRSSGEPFETLYSRITDAIRAGGEPIDAVSIFRRRRLETDIAIHIHHHDVSDSEEPNSLGLHLAVALKSIGIVEHTWWETLK